jgi:hypothetical protein
MLLRSVLRNVLCGCSRYNRGLLLEKGHHTVCFPRLFRVTKEHPSVPVDTAVIIDGDEGAPAAAMCTVTIRDGPDGEGIFAMGGGRVSSAQAVVPRSDLMEVEPCATTLFTELAEEHPKYVLSSGCALPSASPPTSIVIGRVLLIITFVASTQVR